MPIALRIAAFLLALGVLTTAQEPEEPPAQEEQPEPEAAAPETLREAPTRALAAQFRGGDYWAIRCVVLVAFGARYHPAAGEVILEALEDKDERLNAFGLEALRRADDETLRAVASAALVEELINEGLKSSNELYRGRSLEVLRRLFPEVETDSRSAWRRWWRERVDTYAPGPWVDPPLPQGEEANRSISQAFVERAFDLHSAGLDLVICIDSTGSMQSTIDAARAALGDVVAILEGIAPRLRLGLVHYRDDQDMSGGADVLEPLTKKVKQVQKELDGLRAGGGGDYPERVGAGLEAAYSDEMRWERGTNKLVVVIGDAPPKSPGRARKLAEEHYRRPFGVEPSAADARQDGGRTSSKGVVRPFVTSCIAVGSGRVMDDTAQAFRAIAQSGGGTFASFLTTGSGSQASRAVVKHVLRLSFGAQFAEEMDVFVDLYLEYLAAGLY
jgi:hypothetical protein